VCVCGGVVVHMCVRKYVCVFVPGVEDSEDYGIVPDDGGVESEEIDFA